MPNITTFDTNAPYIYLTVSVTADNTTIQEFDAIFDTGAPKTEFSDTALHYAGFLTTIKPAALQNGLQTQKHGKIVLPQLQICGHLITNLEVYVSHFEKSWGIDALIGLDFLRQFKVEIDYSKGVITTDSLPIQCDHKSTQIHKRTD